MMIRSFLALAVVAALVVAAGCTTDERRGPDEAEVVAMIEELAASSQEFGRVRLAGATSDRELFTDAEAYDDLSAAHRRFDRAAAAIIGVDIDRFHPDDRETARSVNATLRTLRSTIDSYMDAGRRRDWAAVERYRSRSETFHDHLVVLLGAR